MIGMQHFLGGEYNFSRAGMVEGSDLGDDLELGNTPLTPEEQRNRHYSTPPRSTPMSTLTSDTEDKKKRKKRTRRTIVLDGFRVNSKLSMLSTPGSEDAENGRRKFRNDLSMSMFRQLGPPIHIL